MSAPKSKQQIQLEAWWLKMNINSVYGSFGHVNADSYSAKPLDEFQYFDFTISKEITETSKGIMTELLSRIEKDVV